MHAIQIAELLALGVILSTLLRFMFNTLCSAEEGFASLFVMHDRTLGWPRGVQESDEPWGWATGLPALTGTASGEGHGSPDDGSGERWLLAPGRAGLVVPIDRVRPVHLEVRIT